MIAFVTLQEGEAVEIEIKHRRRSARLQQGSRFRQSRIRLLELPHMGQGARQAGERKAESSAVAEPAIEIDRALEGRSRLRRSLVDEPSEPMPQPRLVDQRRT